MDNRRQSREMAFALLFEWSFKQHENIKETIDNAKTYRDVKLSSFTRQLVDTAMENIENIDITIEKYLQDWKLNRLSKTSLACLRLAFTELLYIDDIPSAVTANEIIEIAKIYGAEEEPAFINGIIGGYTKEVEKK